MEIAVLWIYVEKIVPHDLYCRYFTQTRRIRFFTRSGMPVIADVVERCFYIKCPGSVSNDAALLVMAGTVGTF